MAFILSFILVGCESSEENTTNEDKATSAINS